MNLDGTNEVPTVANEAIDGCAPNSILASPFFFALVHKLLVVSSCGGVAELRQKLHGGLRRRNDNREK
ncbi:hypothetical protein DEO72_LG6g1351 [Vigna unguiculata]|uniref:Uncharacterized protein n=1 Tax=Vigna unguiculata TaxID=3917 RepID=A0A4D6M9Y8_VIGUN|nr:hypothetical protein DEO72_LG6g1351 [Vigna unguiculata]